ncbi:hypothetical protein AYO38_09540 [bacterium SCGC AG-212-C10]|nr:hypothetical protein AYO38_09540 [bacterium SCGC AG-212-C10]
MELTNATKIRGRHVGWSDELIARIEASPMSEATTANLAILKVAADRVETFVGKVEANPEMLGKIGLRFARGRPERGIRSVPGPNGLGTPEINIGSYGQVPDIWPYENDTPLGSHPDPENYVPGNYHIFEKSEVWAEGVDELYEQGIRERWIPASDLDWASLKELPEEGERAVCQLATVYSSNGLVEQKIISKWFEAISYGFHDVKLFLGTQVYDAGHKVEVLRKRALANGGGMGQAPLGNLYRGWYGSLKFTEMIIALDVTYKSYELTLFEAARDYVKNDLEAKMFDLMARDSRRHLEYGIRHLRWYLQHHPRGPQNAAFWLTRAENALSTELRHSHVERESLVVLLADGTERLAVGVQKLQTIREKQLRNYLDLLDSVGIDRLPKLAGGLEHIAEDPLTTTGAPPVPRV